MLQTNLASVATSEGMCLPMILPKSNVITVPKIPPSMRPQMFHHTHNAPSAGHQGIDKTLNCLQ